MPHEFLFLYGNCASRFTTLMKNHNPDLSSDKGMIYQWEIAEGKSIKAMQENNLIRHIHLLRDGWRTNKSPSKVIQKSLEDAAQHKIIRFIGIEPKQAKDSSEQAKDQTINYH